MKLLKLFKKEKNRKFSDVKTVRRTPTNRNQSFNQTKESQMLLRKIKNRKRSVINSRVVLRKKHGIVKKIGILIVFLGIFSYIVVHFELLDYFDVSFVNVSGANYFVSSDDVKSIVERNYIGQSIFLIDEESIVNVLSKSFLGAKKIVVEKKYPNSLDVTVEERVPLAIVYNEESENFLIDSEGYVLGVVEEDFSNLPKIQYEGSIVVGTFLEKEIIPVSIEILKFADKENLKISSMSFYPNHVRMFVGNSVEVFIGYGGDNEKSLRTVVALLNKPEEEEKMLKKIDLRYDKVIVLYD